MALVSVARHGGTPSRLPTSAPEDQPLPMIRGVGGGSTPPDIPSFVTHEPEGEELSLISSLYACTRNFDDDMSFYQGWKDKQLVRARHSTSMPSPYPCLNDFHPSGGLTRSSNAFHSFVFMRSGP